MGVRDSAVAVIAAWQASQENGTAESLADALAEHGLLPAHEMWGVRTDEAGSVDMYDSEEQARAEQLRHGGVLVCTIDWEPR